MGTGTAERAARLQRDSTARGQRDAGLALSVHPVPIGTKTAEPGKTVRAGRLLTPSQLSMVADKAREYYDKAAKERQKDHGGTAPGRETLPENLPEVMAMPVMPPARPSASPAVAWTSLLPGPYPARLSPRLGRGSLSGQSRRGLRPDIVPLIYTDGFRFWGTFFSPPHW